MLVTLWDSLDWQHEQSVASRILLLLIHMVLKGARWKVDVLGMIMILECGRRSGFSLRSREFLSRSLTQATRFTRQVWGWEPVVCHDTVDTNWGRISDMALHEGKVIGCSIQQSTVGVWIVDLSRVAPFSAGAQSKAAPKPMSRPPTEIRPASNGSDNGSQAASRDSSRATTPAKPISRARTPPESGEQMFSTPSVHAGSASSPPPAKAIDFYAPRASPSAASGARQAGSVIATPPKGSPRPGADVSTAPLTSDRIEKRELHRTPPRRREEATPRGDRGNGGSSSLSKGEDHVGEAAASGSGRTETEGNVNAKQSNGSVMDRGSSKEHERPSQTTTSADDTGQKSGIGRRVSRSEKKEIEFEILAPAGPNPHRVSESDAAGVPTSAEPARAGGKRRSGLFKPEDHDIFGPTRTADGAGLSGRDSDAAVRSENGREAEVPVQSGRGKSPRGEKESRSVALAAPGDSLMRGAALPGPTLSTPEPSGVCEAARSTLESSIGATSESANSGNQRCGLIDHVNSTWLDKTIQQPDARSSATR